MNKDAEGRWKVGRSYIKLKMRVKTYFLVFYLHALDVVDRQFMKAVLEATVSPIDVDFEISYIMKDKCCRDNAKEHTLVNAADPLDNVVNVKNQVSLPLPAIEVNAVDKVVVPGELFEILTRDRWSQGNLGQLSEASC